jgi:hypothetical protein
MLFTGVCFAACAVKSRGGAGIEKVYLFNITIIAWPASKLNLKLERFHEISGKLNPNLDFKTIFGA